MDHGSPSTIVVIFKDYCLKCGFWNKLTPLRINTARKRSLGQGNIFTCMCQSFCSQGRGAGLCMMSLPVWLTGLMFLLGDLCLCSHVPSRVVSVQGASIQGGLCQGDPPGHRPTDMVKSGQYASYWNAFLFYNRVVFKNVYIFHFLSLGWYLSKKFYTVLFLKSSSTQTKSHGKSSKYKIVLFLIQNLKESRFYLIKQNSIHKYGLILSWKLNNLMGNR